MAYTYSSLQTALSVETGIPATDANFLAVLPQVIDDSEQRCYRELDLLASIVTVTGTLTASSRTAVLPTSSGAGTIHFLVVDALNVIDGTGTRHPVLPATREGIDFLYPSNSAPSSPSYPAIFCRSDDLTLLMGPAPDSGYQAEFIGTIRPAPLSATNTSTYLSAYLSDLFFAGCMVSFSGFMRNFGAQADDPKMAITWKSEFDSRLASAKDEELRKSYVSLMSKPPASMKDA